ncbi:unnamed protein product [Microthlaspi erraticum]|uniref:Uncharacterized protein n=1 Tax=Microthlaspi erraticum TaxID=1685480 RepID=A0A6D2HYH4_9BRAS|nr:unnamed protein product [Microthlaspi erraticum]
MFDDPSRLRLPFICAFDFVETDHVSSLDFRSNYAYEMILHLVSWISLKTVICHRTLTNGWIRAPTSTLTETATCLEFLNGSVRYALFGVCSGRCGVMKSK